MGLFSDYLEAVRDKGYDPTMVIGRGGLRYGHGSWYVSSKTNNIQHNVKEYHRFHTSSFKMFTNDKSKQCCILKSGIDNETIRQWSMEQQEKILAVIEKDLCDLEEVRVQHIITEKIVLWIQRQRNLECTIVTDILDEIVNQTISTYKYLNEIKESIGSVIIDHVQYKITSVDESIIKNDIFNMVVESLEYALKNGLQIDRYLFKKMVKDVSVLMHELIPDSVDDSLTDKKQVETYFGKHCNVIKGIEVCQNCGRPIFKSIPYCFNCYDRRELD